MIHYHGEIGGKSTDAIDVWTGRHALVSFARPYQLPVVLDVTQSFVLDNGAFSKWRKDGGRVDFDAYIDWVSCYYRHPSFDWCLIPDIIDGAEADNKDLVIKWVRNPLNIKGVPVWHMHESFDYLEWLIGEFETVSIGSSGNWRTPGSKTWWKRIGEAMRVCCDDEGVPKCKLHGLRMLDPNIFTHIPLSSADSTNAGMNKNDIKMFGRYPPPTAGQRASVIASRIDSYSSSPIWRGFKQADLFMGGEI